MNDIYHKILEESMIPLDETLDYIVNSIEKNVTNKDLISKNLQSKKAILKHVMHQNPVDKLKKKYSSFKNSFAVNTFDILDPFIYEDLFIEPDESINKLIDTVDSLYLLLRDRTAKTTNAKIYSTTIFSSKIEYDHWINEFNTNLNGMVDSAEEIGLWVSHISTKYYDSRFSDFIKNKVNNKLSSIGINNPESAPRDFKTAAIYAKEYIKKLVYTKPKLY